MTKSIRRLGTVGLILLSGIAPLWAEQDEGGATAPKSERRQVVEVVVENQGSSDHSEEGKKRMVTILKAADHSGPVVVSGFSRKRGYLGVQPIELTPELRRHFGAPTGAGVMISRIEEDSPAFRAGLEVGDILIAVDDEQVASATKLERLISALEDQSQIELRIVREGLVHSLPATIVERERSSIDLGRLALAGPGEPLEHVWVGPDKISKHIIRIDPEGLEDAMHELEVRLDRPEFVGKFLDLGQSRLELQQRISELEERLKSLERQLAEFSRN